MVVLPVGGCAFAGQNRRIQRPFGYDKAILDHKVLANAQPVSLQQMDLLYGMG